MKTKYFRDNIEISADQALDARGIVRPGVTVRAPMFAMDSVPKSGFHIDDDGSVFLNGAPYKVPLVLDDAGFARPTLDEKREKVLGPNGADEETEREESDAAPEQLLADGSTVAGHRPGFYRGPRDQAALDRLDAIYATVDAMSAEQYRHADTGIAASTGGHSSGAAPVVGSDAQSVADAYEEYDRIAANAWRAGK